MQQTGNAEEIVEKVQVVHEQGMHARPAAKVVNTALKFASDVYIQYDSHHANAKSIMGLLMLAAAEGSWVTVTCRGPDARAAMDAMRKLFESGFEEV